MMGFRTNAQDAQRPVLPGKTVPFSGIYRVLCGLCGGANPERTTPTVGVGYASEPFSVGRICASEE
jgi:hypothetical protein